MNTVKNILLVDDDNDVHESFVEALSATREVLLMQIATNGREALDKLRRSVILPDFIFLDFQMPLMNGFECLIEIKKDNRLKEIPVVMLSSSKERRDEALALGAIDFIPKPDNDRSLALVLEAIVNGNNFQGGESNVIGIDN